MTDIVEFLRARYAEAKEAAEDASINERRGPHWSVADQPPARWGVEPPDAEILAGGRPIIRFDSEYGGSLAVDHVLLHDPASVLADIDAKLRLLEQFELRGNSVRATVVPATGGVWDDLLRLLALPYAGHADYDRRWRPDDV